MFKKLVLKYLFLFPVSLAAIALAMDINKPFIGHHDFVSAFLGRMAMDFLKDGITALTWTHYLPTLILVTSFMISILGPFEWVIRLFPILISVFGVFYLYKLCSKLWNERVALVASLFYVLNPMFIYFGKLPTPDVPVLAFLIASFYYFVSWLEGQQTKDFKKLCICFFIGALFGWPIGLSLPIFFICVILTKRSLRKIFLLGGIFGVSILIQFGYIFVMSKSLISQDITNTIKLRLVDNNLSFGGQSYNLINFAKQEFAWFQAYYTRTLLLLSLIYVANNLNLKFDYRKICLIFFLFFGLGYVVLFSRYVFIHDFLNIYLLPFVAISAALGAFQLLSILNKRKFTKTVQFLVIVLILTTAFLERLDFTRALLKTEMNRQGLEMAQVLNRYQKKDDEVVIASPRFMSFYGVFANFYSNYDYLVMNEKDLTIKETPKFKYIITIDEDISDREKYDFLVKNYRSIREKDLTIIKLDEKL